MQLAGMPDFPYGFEMGYVETGLVGSIVVIILGQLVPQVLAAQYPIHFANCPGME